MTNTANTSRTIPAKLHANGAPIIRNGLLQREVGNALTAPLAMKLQGWYAMLRIMSRAAPETTATLR